QPGNGKGRARTIAVGVRSGGGAGGGRETTTNGRKPAKDTARSKEAGKASGVRDSGNAKPTSPNVADNHTAPLRPSTGRSGGGSTDPLVVSSSSDEEEAGGGARGGRVKGGSMGGGDMVPTSDRLTW
ncbi:unnamed protein product, partial [Ectocarpus sp. 12 AP-2014]